MRINRYLAAATGLSRRAADKVIAEGKVTVNGAVAQLGTEVGETDKVTLDGRPITPDVKKVVLLLNKPVGYVCSRDGQGSLTVYDLLPKEYNHLKPVGRLDKDSSGLLLLTNDGVLANELTHPKYQKEKRYIVRLNHELSEKDFETITKPGVALEDGVSRLGLDYVNDQNFEWKVTISEGRNRQIRRTFAALGYKVLKLHRTHFGKYVLPRNMQSGEFSEVEMV